MQRGRKIALIITSVAFLLCLIGFANQTGQDTISVTAKQYAITRIKDSVGKNAANAALEQFATTHKIAIVKQFVVPTVGSEPVKKFYVLGDKKRINQHVLPKRAFATKQEFVTSDVHYPLYFFGTISDAEIAHELKQLGFSFERQSTSIRELILYYVYYQQNYVDVLLLLVLLILLIVLVVANFQRLRASNIKQLQGISRFEDSLQVLKQDQVFFLKVYLLNGLILVGYTYFRNILGALHPVLVLMVVLWLMELAVAWFSAFVQMFSHSEKTILMSIKGKQRSKLVFTLNWMFKIITEFAIVIMLVVIFQNLGTANQIKQQLSTWSKLPDYYSLYLAATTTDGNDIGDTDEPAYRLAKWGNNHGMIVSNYGGMSGDTSSYLDCNNGNVLIANANYLKINKLVSTQNKRIIIPNNTATTYALIPANAKAQAQKLIKSYRNILFFKELQKDHPQMNIKPIIIKPHQRVFDYETQGFELGKYNGYLNNPVVLVVSPQSVGGNNDIATSMWSSILSGEGLLFPHFNKLTAQVQRQNLTPQVGGYLNVNSVAAKALHDTNNQIRLLVGIVILLSVLALVEYQLVNSVYLTTNRRKSAIKRLNGQSLFKIHGRFMLCWGVVTIGEVGVLVYGLTEPVKVTVMFAGISTCVASGLFYWQARRDMREIVATIEGE